MRDASVGDQVARHSTARGTAAAPSQQTNASKEQSGESGTHYRTGNANRSDESAHNAEIAEGHINAGQAREEGDRAGKAIDLGHHQRHLMARRAAASVLSCGFPCSNPRVPIRSGQPAGAYRPRPSWR